MTNTEQMATITGNKVQEIREELDLNIDQMAQLLNVSSRTIQRWEDDGIDTSGKSAGKQNFQDLLNVMESKIARKELFNTLSKFRGAGMAIGIPLISSVLDTLSLITSGAGVYVGQEIVDMLQNVIEKQKNSKK